ncbi:MAG TPA: peptidylprolyl isomerase [Steroidobacteraceae bacterium]|nr:peptidylprolyl isomerase [Steroidobacteraceae bacterium]
MAQSESIQATRPRFGARLVRTLAHPRLATTVLPACGVVLGLAAAGASLFRPVARPLTSVPPGYVALVDQKGVLMSDFIAQTQSETGADFADTSPQERRRVLREMIDQELLVQRALVLDLPETTTEVRETMASAVNAQVEAPLLALEPTDAQLRAFYDAHRARYTLGGTMTVHDLLLHFGGYADADQTLAQAEVDAAEAVYQLRSGAPIDYVMEHYGFVDSGRVDNTEQLEFAAKLHLGAKLYQVATTLGDGEVSDPVAMADGVHVLVMDRRRPPRPADFDSVRNTVYSDYRAAESARARAENLRILRSQARILLAPGQSE